MLSILNYLFNPVSFHYIIENRFFIIEAINFLIIPQIGFYLLGGVIVKDRSNLLNVYKQIGRIHFFTFSFGIVLYLTRPYFYIEYLHVVQKAFYENVSWFYPRLVSYLDTSMILGVVGVFSIVLIYYYEPHKKLKMLMLPIIIFGVAMTLSRGAWIGLSLALILIILEKIELKRLFILILVSSLLVYVGSIFYLQGQEDPLVKLIINRVSQIDNAIESRYGQWEQIINQMNVFPLGFGLGLTSHKGIGFNYGVPDGNYFRILGDLGFFGLFIFLLMFMFSLYRAYKYSYPLFIILVIFFFQAIGTNVFDLYYAGYYFWFFLGIINNLDFNEAILYRRQ
jgi:O-antigen ligase